MYHYTTVDGYKAISSQPDWVFKAAKPPGPHPVGAYFTPLPPGATDLCTRLLIPRRKVEYTFEFAREDGLRTIRGRRRIDVFYSPTDYVVNRTGGLQRYAGPAAAHPQPADPK